MTRRERLLMGTLLVLLLLGGGLVWSVALRPTLEPDVSPLAGLPREFGMWRAVADIPLEDVAEALLRADFSLQRVYWHPVGGEVALYVGYYGTERGGRPEHTPDVCYPNAGWEIAYSKPVTIDPGRGLRANEFEAVREGTRQLVFYWYRSYRGTGLLGTFDQVLDRLAGRIFDHRSDGAIVRASTLIRPGAEEEARRRLRAFASELDPLLDEVWPTERPARG